LLALGPTGTASAKHRKASAKPATGARAPAKVLNACGCYADLSGKCFCGRRGKCECPGECEPKGCEEKRSRQMQKEIAAETKKATAIDRKERQEEKRRELLPPKEDKPKAPEKDSTAKAPEKDSTAKTPQKDSTAKAPQKADDTTTK